MAKSKTETDSATREPRIDRYTEVLRVELTTEEIAERASQAAHKLQDRDNKEGEMKAAVKSMKAVIEEIEAELRRLSGEVRDGCVFSPVECERRFDFAEGTVTETRTDTEKIIHTRALRDDERVQSLPFAGEE